MQDGHKVPERGGSPTGMMTLLPLLQSVHGGTYQKEREVGWVFLEKEKKHPGDNW